MSSDADMPRCPAGVSAWVFFSNKEALKRLSCVDSSYFHTLFFIVCYYRLPCTRFVLGRTHFNQLAAQPAKPGSLTNEGWDLEAEITSLRRNKWSERYSCTTSNVLQKFMYARDSHEKCPMLVDVLLSQGVAGKRVLVFVNTKQKEGMLEEFLKRDAARWVEEFLGHAAR